MAKSEELEMKDRKEGIGDEGSTGREDEIGEDRADETGRGFCSDEATNPLCLARFPFIKVVQESPGLRSYYLSSSGLLSWVGFTHTHTCSWKGLRAVDPAALARPVTPSRHLLAPRRLLCLAEMMNRTPPPLLLFFSFISGFPFSFCHLF